MYYVLAWDINRNDAPVFRSFASRITFIPESIAKQIGMHDPEVQPV